MYIFKGGMPPLIWGRLLAHASQIVLHRDWWEQQVSHIPRLSASDPQVRYHRAVVRVMLHQDTYAMPHLLEEVVEVFYMPNRLEQMLMY